MVSSVPTEVGVIPTTTPKEALRQRNGVNKEVTTEKDQVGTNVKVEKVVESEPAEWLQPSASVLERVVDIAWLITSIVIRQLLTIINWMISQVPQPTKDWFQGTVMTRHRSIL